jgi:hypothetical protein
MNDFDLKKYLSENKLTANSKMLDEEQNIKVDAENLLDDLKQKGIVDDDSYVESTGPDARGKNKIFATSTQYNNSGAFEDAIANSYQKVGSTGLSSDVYSNGKVHFFFYSKGSSNFEIVVRRKNYKG